MDLRKARKTIDNALDKAGPFSHNICSMVLLSVSKTIGVKEANALVDEFSLDDIYGIQKVEEPK